MGTPNSIPYEVIAAPYVVWVALVGEAFPAVDAAPGAGWTRLGTSGELNYTDDGVTVQHTQNIEQWRGGGDTGVRKVFRTEDGLIVGFSLADLTLEQYRYALNANPVTTVAADEGTAGYKTVGLSRGNEVAQRALLIRGASPYGDDMTMQYEIPIAFQTGEQEVGLGQKGVPAALMLEWTAIIDSNAATPAERYGRLVAQHQVAL